jgi:hypothetical protein
MLRFDDSDDIESSERIRPGGSISPTSTMGYSLPMGYSPGDRPHMSLESWRRKVGAVADDRMHRQGCDEGGWQAEVSISRKYMHDLIMNYLIIEGYKEAAQDFEREAGIECEWMGYSLHVRACGLRCLNPSWGPQPALLCRRSRIA